jgi:ABC transport system ATP-binding/permease protein
MSGDGRPFLVVGSADDCDVVCAGSGVLPHHARLARTAAGFELLRLEPEGEVLVNGAAIVEPRSLADGDLITLGEAAFRFAHGVLAPVWEVGDGPLDANGLVVDLDDGRRILDEVGFYLEPSSLLAIVGPSGSGKSTLVNALTGAAPADEGSVTLGPRNLYAELDELRSSIGIVPQAEVLHYQLTVESALTYAAALRFPPTVDGEARRRRVIEVMDELDIGQRADTRIADLSGGQRKRVSVALELLTKPSLLFLDEPTSGLDPGNERELMSLLRGLATRGRIVVVVTHSTQSLDLCDRILVLAPGGTLAYYGPPSELGGYFGERVGEQGYAALFEELEESTAVDWKSRFRADRRYSEYVREALPAPRPPGRAEASPPPLQPPLRQFRVLARRQLSLIAAERRTALFLGVQAPTLAALFLLVFHSDVFTTREGFRGVQLLWLLVVGVTWMGLASTILEIVKETSVYRRERAVGLSIGAYVGSKAVVLGGISMVQAVLLTWLVLAFQAMPPRDDLCSAPTPAGSDCYLDLLARNGFEVNPLGSGALLSSASLELTLVLMVAGLAAAMLGLLVSAAVRTSDQALRLLPVVLAAQIVLSLPGSVGRAVEILGVPASARWGTAAAASTMGAVELQTPYYTANATGLFGLKSFVGAYEPEDLEEAERLFLEDFNEGVDRARIFGWAHEARVWLGDMAMLLVLAGGALVGSWLVLRRRDATGVRARGRPARRAPDAGGRSTAPQR